MITSCLLNYVGLQGCGSTVPASGRYLNDLSGISIEKADMIANDEQQNYVGVWNDIQKRALLRLQTDIKSAFLTKYKLKGVTRSVNLQEVIDTGSTTIAGTQYRGFKYELNDATDEIVYSVLQAIHIQSLKVYVSLGTPTFDVKVFDLDTGEELFTEEITVTTTGWQSIDVNTYFRSRRIFVCYDSTSITSVDLNIEDFNLDVCYKCQGMLKGANSEIATPTTLTEDVYNTYGLSAVMSVKCVWDTLVCNNKESFVSALLYALAIEFVLEWKMTDRVNRWSSIDLPKANWLFSYYSALYKGGVFEEIEYDSALLDAIETFDVDCADCCADCHGEITFQDSYI